MKRTLPLIIFIFLISFQLLVAQKFNVTICVKSYDINQPISNVLVQIGGVQPQYTSASGCCTFNLSRALFLNKEAIINLKKTEYQNYADYKLLSEGSKIDLYLLRNDEIEKLIKENEKLKEENSTKWSPSGKMKDDLKKDMNEYEVERISKENTQLKAERKQLIDALKIQTYTNSELTKYLLQKDERNRILQAKIDTLEKSNFELSEIVTLYKAFTDSLKNDIIELKEVISLLDDEDYKKSIKATNIHLSINSNDAVYFAFDLVGRQDSLQPTKIPVTLTIRVNQLEMRNKILSFQDSLVCSEQGQKNDKYSMNIPAVIGQTNVNDNYPSLNAFKSALFKTNYFEIVIFYKDILIGKQIILH